MIPYFTKLTADDFFIASVIVGVLGIFSFLIHRGRSLAGGDIVPVLIIFGSCLGFVNFGCQVWYVVLMKQDLGVLQNHKAAILTSSIAMMWVSVLAIIKSFKK